MPSPMDGLQVEVAEDQTKAFISYAFPAGMTDARLDTDEVLRVLQDTHKLIGVNEELVTTIIENFNDSSEPFDKVVVADSERAMVEGEDGSLEWCIEREPQLVEDELGRVDFYAFSALKNVGEGQLLARLHEPIPGVDGLSVRGEPIPARPVNDVTYVAGENVEFEEEERVFYASTKGRVEVRGQAICVSRLFEVSGDVDFSVGNIQFDGFVRITGNVMDNFQISASDGVQIDGVVQAAKIRSGGTISLIGGANCRGKGRIDSKADVLAKFVNNVMLTAEGSLKAEKEIVNCRVYAAEVDSPKAQVAGGQIVATESIDVKEAGSPLGVRTILHAGHNYFIEQEVKHLESDLEALNTRIKLLDSKLGAANSILDKMSENKRDGLTAMLMRTDTLREKVPELEEEIEEKKRKIVSNDAQVVIRGVVHPGVVVRIGRYEKSMPQKFEGYRRYVFDKNKYDIVAYFEEEK